MKRASRLIIFLMPSSVTDWEHAHGSRPAPSSWHTQLDHDKTFHVIGFTDGVATDDTKLVLGGWDSRGNPGEANSIRVFSRAIHHDILEFCARVLAT